MTRSRNRLHISKLGEFTRFCEMFGWRKVALKGDFEVLRMVRPYREPLIVYTRLNAKEHYTTHGIADKILDEFLHKDEILNDEPCFGDERYHAND